MSSATVTKAPTNGTDAEFRAWGKAISDQLVTGWTKTADTGQIDWATVVKPVGAATAAGYEIWYSNDAGGGLSNIYFKIEYGSQTGGTQAPPALWITVGFASDGVGNISGLSKTIRQTIKLTNGSSSSTTLECHLGVGTCWFAIYMFCGISTNMGGFIAIERSRDAAGAFLDECILSVSNANGAIIVQLLSPTILRNFQTAFCQLLINPVDAIAGTDSGVSIQFAQRAGPTNPLMGYFGCGLAQFGPVGSVVSITSYGAARNYIVNNFTGASSGIAFFSSGIYLLSRYE